MEVAFISDVHGKWDVYEELCKKYANTIQVGDFGMGFEYETRREAPRLSLNHRFIRGNHDSPQKCYSHPNFIKDGTIETIGSTKVMFIGGAWSSDQYRRTEGKNWWRDEECSYADFQKFLDLYEAEKPDLMVTHDCPSDFAKLYLLGAHKPPYPSVTGNALMVMHNIHQPKNWVFGHWHSDICQEHNGTVFHCSRDTRLTNHGVIVLDL
jgi:hypothetical protein